jgi:hypothetical protein
VCGVTRDQYDELLRTEQFQSDVREALNLRQTHNMYFSGSVNFSRRAVIEAEMAESGHGVNNIDYVDVLFEPESPRTTLPITDLALAGPVLPRSPRPQLQIGWNDDVTVGSEADADFTDFDTESVRELATVAPRITPGEQLVLADRIYEGARLNPSVLPPEPGVVRHSVVSRAGQARGLVLREVMVDPSTLGRRRRRQQVVRTRVINPVLVAELVAEVICRVGTLRDNPANRLLVERTALLRIREGDDGMPNERKWFPADVSAYLPRVVDAYFDCNNFMDGIGTSVQRSMVNAGAYFRLVDDLRGSPFVFQ